MNRFASRTLAGALLACAFAVGAAPAIAATSVDFTQKAAKKTIVPGQQAQFTIRLSNTGTESAVFPQLYGDLPGGGNIEWFTTTRGCHTYGSPPTQTFECDFDYLSSKSVQTAEVHGVPTACTVLDNTVTISGANFASVSDNDLIVVTCPAAGSMTGAAGIVVADVAVTHAFALSCDVTDKRQNLDVTWQRGDKSGKKGQNDFRLSTVTSAECINDPTIAPPPPGTGFTTLVGRGFGTCNGLYAEISYVFTASGKAGVADTAEYDISEGCTLAAAETALVKGNQQAHRN
jgi:hypothetical protein